MQGVEANGGFEDEASRASLQAADAREKLALKNAARSIVRCDLAYALCPPPPFKNANRSVVHCDLAYALCPSPPTPPPHTHTQMSPSQAKIAAM